MEWLVLMSITNVLFVNKVRDEKNNDTDNGNVVTKWVLS